MKRFEKWRANFFVRFLTIVGLSKAATFTILAEFRAFAYGMNG